ncbi:MAG: Cof-type HAD-IIB family hydrolase [Lachnospirales bacterium]
MYKILSIDLDGTLLNDNLKISSANKKAIAHCLEKDIQIVLSSGRSADSMKPFIEELNLNQYPFYASAFHGAYIFKTDTMEPIKETSFNRINALGILSNLKKNKEIGIVVYKGNNEALTEDHNKNVKIYENKVKIPIIEIKDYRNIKTDVLKIVVIGHSANLKEVYNEFKYLNTTNDARTFYSNTNLLEFMSHIASKGTALEYIAKASKINMEETIGIGDNENDISLVAAAKVGVAVNNAVDGLKEVADYITEKTNDNNAVAEVIEKYIG